MSKQIGHITASTIDIICFVDTEGIGSLVMIAGGASASITAIMPFGVYTIAADFEAVFNPCL